MEKVLNSLMAAVMMLILCALGGTSSAAMDYPTKPITVINPMAPGGANDMLVRPFAALAEKELGQPVVVVNKAGASGLIGLMASAQAAPDGYTLGMGTTAMTCVVEWEIANGRKPQITRQDFITIGALTQSPTLVIVPFNSPWKTLSDLINDCKSKPNHYAFGSAGLYGESHMGCVVLMKASGIKCRHVPFTGGGPTVTAVVGGHVDFATQFPPTSIPLARANKLRILAVQGDKRLKSIPEIPTIKELGIDAEWLTWRGLMVPEKTPTPIVQKLREDMMKVVNTKPFIDTIEGVGEEVRPMNGVALASYWETESKRVAELMRDLAREVKEPSPK
jgi:tripartite-type tricarboxylate transporter receptor subunit TctC